MNYKELVKSIYPGAHEYHYNMPNGAGDWFAIRVFEEDGVACYGDNYDSMKDAWKLTWKQIQKSMLRKLEL